MDTVACRDDRVYASPGVAALPLVKVQQATRKVNKTAIEPFIAHL